MPMESNWSNLGSLMSMAMLSFSLASDSWFLGVFLPKLTFLLEADRLIVGHSDAAVFLG